jgi:hypothetical protein
VTGPGQGTLGSQLVFDKYFEEWIVLLSIRELSKAFKKSFEIYMPYKYQQCVVISDLMESLFSFQLLESLGSFL